MVLQASRCETSAISFAGLPLDDEHTIASYGISDLSRLHVSLRLR